MSCAQSPLNHDQAALLRHADCLLHSGGDAEVHIYGDNISHLLPFKAALYADPALIGVQIVQNFGVKQMKRYWCLAPRQAVSQALQGVSFVALNIASKG
jgi:hypothetical protein